LQADHQYLDSQVRTLPTFFSVEVTNKENVVDQTCLSSL
jgi:hypothetical protein